jgi:hypothetical protein
LPKTTNEPPTWIPVGELAEAFERKSNVLPPTADLKGMNLRLYFENGWVIEHKFTTTRTLWRRTPSTRGQQWTRESYLATKVREGMYFVDFLEHLKRATTISLALDLRARIFTAVIGQLPTRTETKEGLLERVVSGKELTGVKATFLSGSVNEAFDESKTVRHSRTDELIGKRIEYIYSPTERYEHVYLNRGFYTWHCLAGAERKEGIGLADTDRCHYYKLGERLYLFSWQEKIIPTHGVVIIDLDKMRTTGKIFGYTGNNLGRLSNFPVGAKARLLAQIPRED